MSDFKGTNRIILNKETVERAIEFWYRHRIAAPFISLRIEKVQPSHPSHFLHVCIEGDPIVTEPKGLTLVSHGEKKINVIKEVRAATGLGLKEAKEMVESAPCPIEPIIGWEIDISATKRALEIAGATVELR